MWYTENYVITHVLLCDNIRCHGCVVLDLCWGDGVNVGFGELEFSSSVSEPYCWLSAAEAEFCLPAPAVTHVWKASIVGGFFGQDIPEYK